MAAVYGEERVNYYTTDYQYSPQAAGLVGGGYVLTWISRGQDGAVDGIYAQRYNASGSAVGAEFQVNTQTAGSQVDPAITGLADGGFVIAWSDPNGDGSESGVYAQRYDVAGIAQGGQFRLNTYTASNQYVPDLAAFSTGGFIATWASYGQDGSTYGIYAQRYDAAGTAVGAEFKVNSTTSNEQTELHVATFGDGSFVVVWRSYLQDGDSYGIYAQRFSAAGLATGSEFRVNTTTASAQYEEQVAALEGGGFVVVWRSEDQDGSNAGVYAQRYQADGSPAGGEFRVNVSTLGGQYQPDISALANGGFAVTWYNDNSDVSGTGSYADVYVREFAADGTPLTGQVKVNTPNGSTSQYEPTIAHIGSDNYVIAWRSDAQDGSNSGIYQQLMGTATELARSEAPTLGDFGGSVSFGENLVNASPQLLDPVVSFTDLDSPSMAGGLVTVFYVSGASAGDQLAISSEGMAAGQISVSGSSVSFGGTVFGTLVGGSNGSNLSVSLNAAATPDAVEALIQRITYGSSDNSPAPTRQIGVRVEDGGGASAMGGVMTINLTKELDGTPAVYGEEQVNTYTPGQQQWPSVATLGDGSYVVAWQSDNQDGSGWGVYAQRFANNGEALGPEQRVNTLTGSDQSWPQIAGLSNGGYVIAWQDNANDGSGWGVFGQRYDANNLAEGDQFRINTTTSGDQYNDSLAAYTDGFAAVWSTSNDIYLQRYSNAGVKQGAETLVSTVPGGGTAQSGAQYLPDVAAYANGNLVIVWTDAGGNDGDSFGVYGRTYNAGTGSFGSSFLVNTTTSSYQGYSNDGNYAPNVAVLSNGDFVVVWPSYNQDSPSTWAVTGQRFDAAGNKLGGEFQVNETLAGSQYIPDVTALSSGGFVVTFYNDNYDIDGTGSTGDVYLREYDAGGNPVDGQRKVNATTASTQWESAVADLGNGNYAVVWAGYNAEAGTANTYGIFQQLYGDSTELARSASPQLGDFTGTVTFAENAVNAGLQVIDAAVGLSDPDSGNFNGGRLDLYYVQNGSAEDQLGVVSQGSGAGQIGVSGSTVSYGGAVIGTVSGGSNGANLRIDFTSDAASVEAVEALIQHLGYRNADSSPNVSRTLGLRVSDGDGGSSAPSMLTIMVTGDADGTPAVYGEEQVNTYTPGQQQWPSVATLGDGSYVVAWQSDNQDGSGWGVYAQRFANNGEALGPEQRVNTLTGSDQSWPQIAGLSNGGYVIAWQDNANDGSGWGVFGQRYDANNLAEGDQFRINTTTSGDQYNDSLAAYTDGFAAVWSTSNDIYLQRYSNAGVKQGAETLVSTVPGGGTAQSGAQYLPDVAAYANGNLVIVWTDAGGNDGDSFGVYGRTYNAGTGSFGSSFLVNTTTSSYQGYSNDGNYAPNVAVLSNGDFVVVWPSYNQDSPSTWAVTGQRFDAAGNKLGGEFQVNETLAGSQYIPDVTALSSGGFVVTFYNDNYDIDGTGSTGDVYLREYDAGGNPVDGQRKVNATTASTQWESAVADLGNGNYAVVWAGYNAEAGTANTYGIFQQLYGDSTELARSASPQLGDFTGTVTFAENAVNAGLQVIDAAVGLSDPDSGNFNGGRLDLYYVQNGSAEDQLGVVSQGSGAGQIGVSGSTVSYGGAVIGTVSGGSNGANLRIDFTSDAASVEAVEALIQHLGYRNADSSPNVSRTLGLRVSDGDGGSSAPSMLTIMVTGDADGTPAVYGEEQVNTYTYDYQYAPAVAGLAGGGYVTTWISRSQDGAAGADGIYAQRFLENGEAVGPEFRVNSTTAGNQRDVKVAGLSDGSFVLAWTDQNGNPDGSGYGVYGQRFDAAGNALGGQFLINATSTSSNQEAPAIAAFESGGFVVTWDSSASLANGGDGSGDGVYAQRFNNDGTTNGGMFRVDTTTANSQYESDVAAHADGSFVVSWRSDAQDGSGAGVYFQRYDAAGVALGAETRANTITISSQYEAKIATLGGGGFVIVWRDDGGQDGSANAVFGQRFDAAGTPLGDQFRVNETTSGSQYQPDVVGLDNGGFVVTFYNDNYDLSGSGSTADVYIREYDLNGVAVDGQRKVNTFTGSSQQEPAIAHLGSDNFVVTWRSETQDGSNSGVYQQLFGTAAELPRASSNPVLDDFRAQRILVSDAASSFYAGTPQLIDGDVGVQDADSADFDGGSFTVTLLNGATATEALGIRNQGTGTLQIGVAGSDISFAGTVIGSFTGGGAGNSLLTVTLNANATPLAIRGLAQNITYQNTAPPAGTTDRYVSFRLTDGDGGTSNAANVEIQIQPTLTPTAVAVDDIETSVTLTEAQAQAGGFVLDNAAQVNYNGAGNFNTGTLTVSYLSSTSRVDDQLAIRNQGSGANEVGISGTAVSFQGTEIGTLSSTLNGANGKNLQITWNASATDQSIERVIENLTYGNTSDGPNASRSIRFVLTDSSGTASTARDMQINVTPQVDGASPIFGEQQVNTYEPNEQHVPVTTGLQGVNDGSYVVVWRSNGQDGSSYGIYGQRYDSRGGAVGAEFQVNSQTLGAQYEAEVASLANGGFVVVWRDDSGRDGSGAGIYAQIYGADGARVGGERLINTTTTGSQYEPAVVGLSDGSFVVAYRSDYTGGAYTTDVLARRFDAAGTELTAEFTLNTTTSGTQYNPRLAALAGGQFVVVYGDASGNDGSSYGVFSKVFNANGTEAVAEQLANTTISGQQSGHDVVALAGGGYVATWWSADNHLYGQRFDASGAKVNGEFRISTVDTQPNNNFARVTALDSGGFVVAWDANGYEVYIQQFDASGNKVDGPTQVNTTTASTQYYADVAGLSGSNFVVTWAGYGQEAGGPNTYGIFSQILGAPGSLTRSAAPELVDVATSVTFAENLVNATPQLIDSAVRLSDADSASFNGGQLVVSVVVAGQNQVDTPFSQDQLGIRNTGTGTGQIGVSGSDVSYQGTTIGTIVSSGANGGTLAVNLNANATAGAVEALIEHLTYANSSTNPAVTRLVSIQVSDGLGGASVPRTVQINVTPQVDGASPIFGEQQVNTYEPNEQHVPVTTGLQGVNDGSYVVVWRSNGQDGSSYGIYGQRYDSRGGAVGAEFQVNSQTLGAQYEAEVASLANGGFVVVWRDDSGRDGSGAGIYAQIYGADGARVGGERLINTTTTGSQYEPAVVGLSDGSFVVAYRSDYTGGAYTTDVLARRFDAAGTELTAEFTLNTTTSGTQYNPRLAALAGGQFVVVYGDASGNDGSSYGVFSKVFNANGTEAVAEQLANTTISGQQSGHDVVALAGGGYVATWWSADNHLYGQRFDASGAKVNGEFRISTVDTQPNNNFARVTALDSGGFVVAWDANGYEVYIQQFDASGNKVDGPTQVNTTTASTQYYADVAGLSGSNFVVTWAGYGQEAGGPNTYGIFSQILGAPGSLTRSAAPELVDVATSVTFAENLVNATPQLIDSAVRLSDADSASFNGGQLVVSVISGYGNIEQAQLPNSPEAQDQFGIRNQGSGAGQVDVSGSNVRYGGSVIGTISSDGLNGHDFVVTFNASATSGAVEAVIENLTYRNAVSNPVASRMVSIQVSDGAGGASAPQVVQINITPEYDGAQPLYQEDSVNTYTPSNQSQPAMARLEDGGYVTVWTSEIQDGWGYGIYGQRYDAAGVAVGNQFQVNDYTPYNQTEPAISSLAGGGFVVVWRDDGGHDGSSYGVFGQRYDAAGLQVGNALLINSHTGSAQYQPSIASVAGGGFIVAWYSDATQDGRAYDVYFQRFDNSGTPLGTETRANASAGFVNSAQYEPAVTVLSDASFVVTWRSDSQDGSSSGVYGQRFAADGTALGGEFRVNTYTDSSQLDPSIAALSGGGFVVSWTSYYQDGGGTYGVFAQRYANDGTPLGGEFRVNTSTASNEQQSSVTALDNGGFAIVWSNGSEIYAQQYSAGGVAVDGETRIDVLDDNYAIEPAVLGLGNGNFVVSWTDRGDGGGNSYGIYQRVLGNPADFSRQANPVLVDVAQSVTFGENELNLMPRLIDPGVGLYDADSANFAGGRLEVDYISGYGGQDQLGMQGLENQDQLGILSEGDGLAQVRVSGLNVFYSGVQVGTITANGANHGKLVIEFNASANVDAVESVIENLTYQNTSSNPFASRTVSLRLTDGDGGASDAKFITLNVTSAVDGAVPLGLEKSVNTTVAGDQSEPSVAHLAGGGYVVVWTDQGGADGSNYGVYAQRYDADNNPVGVEFRVNATTTNYQYEPQVVGLADGGYVVVWRSDAQDGSSAGVFAQRYDELGAPAGSEFRVNESTPGGQYQPDVAALASGGFVVTWFNDNYDVVPGTGSYADVYVRHYGADGSASAGQIKANTPTASQSTQSEPTVAVLDDGSFVVVWRSDSAQDGSGTGVYAQRFAANGAAIGSEFRVNTYTDSNQYQPDIAALKDGGFLVVWRSEAQDLSGGGVYAQRYDASGATVGAEFRVNTSTNSTQEDPAVTALENGGWVVTWTDLYGAAPNTYDVFLQQYDAAGRQMDGQTLVNTYTPYVQYQPAITSMPDGGFVVAYSSYVYSSDQNGDGVPDGGNDTYEIRLQRYSNTAPVLTDVFVSGQEDSPIILTDDLFISGFHDPEGQNLAAIKITTLPAEGSMKLDGVAVTIGQEISLADLQANRLTYQGDPNYFGLDQFAWTGSDGVAFAPTPVFTNINLSNVNDAPALEAGPNDTAAEGTYFSHAISLGDPDPDTHRVTVNWGDGTPNSVYETSTDLLNISHYFPDNGTYNVSVTANDQQGQANSVEVDGFQVTVGNVAPDLSLFGDGSVLQSEVYTLTLGGVIDPGADTVSEYRIDWGDGTGVQSIAAASLPANRQISHAYTATGAKTIGVSLVDEDGTHASVATKAITVSAPAEVLTVDAGADRTVNEGSFVLQTINFSDPTDTDPAGRLYTVNWGDGATSSGRSFGASSLDVGHTYADGGNVYTVSVTLDDDGAQQASDSFQVTVNNVAPTLSLGGAATTSEGSVYTLVITATDPGNDLISGYRIDWGDSSPDTLLTAAELALTNGNVTHTYLDGTADRTITVQATDEDGTWSNTRTISVADVAPVVELTGGNTVDEGGSYTLTLASITDPGSDTALSYTINWGDGNAEVVASLGSYSHTYADGTTSRTISVLVTDEEGAHANAGTKTITVNNVAPAASVSGPATVDEGSVYTLTVGAILEPGADTRSGYAIAWGDGSTDNFGPAQWAAAAGSFTHTYADGTSALTITVSTTDEDGITVLGTQAVMVNNVAPTASLSGASAVDEGSIYTLTVGAISDPGADTRSGYTIAWGDGNTDTLSPAQWAAAAGNFTHTYADGTSALTITVSTTDEDGSTVLGTQAVTVNNVAPAASVSGASAVDEGSVYTLTVGAILEPGTDTRSGYAIAWGDGNTDSFTPAQWAAAAGSFTHTYADGASALTITVRTTDEDGITVLGTQAVMVNNVAPAASVSGASAVDEGSVYTLTVGAISDPGADTRSAYTIAWGDGNTDTLSPAQWAAAAGSFTHTYADGTSEPTITVSTTDEDGTTVLGTQAVTVNDVAPSASLSGAGAVDEGSVYTLTVGAITDPGADTRSGYTIAWGDGSTDTFTPADWAAAAGSFTHTYADGAATSTITVSTTDEDGTTVLGTHAVDVLNVAPTVDATGAASATVGVAYTLSLANYVDPGQDTLLPNGIVVDWGDGTQSTASSLGDLTHTYLAASTPTLTVSLADEDGSYANVASLGLTVGLPTPTLSLAAQAAGTVNEGSAVTRSIAFSDGEDSNGDGWNYTVQWNDGVVQSGTTTVQHFDLNRTAADGNATLTATITVSDTGGADSDSTSLQLNVANVAPTASLSGPTTVDEGSVYTLTVGAILEPGTDTRSAYTIAWGDGSTDSFTPAQWAAAAGSFTHTYADGASAPTIIVSTTDEDGTTVLGTQAVAVANVAPSLVLDGAASTLEGATYQLTLTGSDAAGSADPLAYSIAWGDGSTQTILAADLPPSGIVSHVFADDEDGPANATARQVTVTVTDGDGGSTEVSKTVTVSNVAPTASLSGPTTVDEGSVYTLTVGAILEPGTDTRSAYTIAWGDGSTDSFTPAQWAAAAGSFTHTYADGASAPTIIVSTTDEDGTTVLGTQAVAVANVAPSLVLDGAASTLEGATYQLTLTGSDAAGSADPLAYSIAWGDGSTQTILAADLPPSGIVSHVFADDEDGPANATARQVTVTVTDGDGGSTEVSKTVTVSNVAPAASLSGPATVDEGSVYTLTVGAILEPGADTRSGYTIAWGDGNTDILSPAQWAAAAGNFTHTYADGASAPTITVSTTDEDGTTVLGTQSVTVVNVAPSLALDGAASTLEGATYQLTLTGSDVAGTADPLAYSIAWGDGSTQTLLAADLPASGIVSHVFTDDEDGPANATARQVTVTVTDGDGGSTEVSKTVTVNNVAPIIEASGAASATTGLAYTLSLANYLDPGQDTLLPDGILINWGDGSTSTASAVSDITHTYSAAGTPTILVSLADEDGSYANVASLGLTVVTGGGGNHAPVADDEVFNLRPNQVLDIAAPGVLDGDLDADGDVLSVSAVDTTGLAGSLIQLANGAFRFTPTTDFVGSTAFNYTVSDGKGGFDTGLVTLNVVNSAPQAGNNSYTVHAGVPLVITSPGLMGNDADFDMDALFISAWDASGLNGDLDLSADGSFSFTPSAGFTGNTSFSYTVADGYGGTSTGVVGITVTNIAPVADDEILHVWRNGSLDITAPGILTGDVDADGDTLSVSGVDTTGLVGSLVYNADGSLHFTPTAGFSGTTGFSYQVSDGNGGVDTGSVTFEVVPETTATRIGAAPDRQFNGGGQWASAWTHTGIDAQHKHDATSTAEAWSAVTYHGVSPQNLAGGDIYTGDLGVSSQSAATSSVRQEIDGKEALRFNLAEEATGVTVNLSRFFINDDGSLYTESGRLRLIDDSGTVVAETTFNATSAAGTQQVSLGSSAGFSHVELSAGAYDGTDFVFGGYQDGAGHFGSAITTDGAGIQHGSDFLVDWVEFDFPIVGVPLPHDEL